MKSPTVLDIFCGAGGMSLGFQNAGCEILGGIDKNPHAIRTHHKNFPNCKLMRDSQSIESIRPLAKKICVILKNLLKFRSNFELLG